MDRNHVVQIILKARDEISKVVKPMIDNVEKGLNKLNDSFDRSGRSGDDFDKSLSRNLDNIDKKTGKFTTNIRNHLKGLQDSLVETRKEASKEFPTFGGGTATRGPGGRFVAQPPQREAPIDDIAAGFKEGRQAASETEKFIRERIALSKEEQRTTRDTIRETHRIQTEAARQQTIREKQELEVVQAANKKTLDEEIKKRRKAFQDEEAKKEDSLSKEIRKKKVAFDKERDDRAADLRKSQRDIKKEAIGVDLDSKLQLNRDLEAIKARRAAGELSVLQAKQESDILRFGAKSEAADRLAARNEEIEKLNDANIEINRKNSAARDVDVAKLKQAERDAASIRKRSIDDEVSRKTKSFKDQSSEEERNRQADVRARQRTIDLNKETRLRQVSGIDQGQIIKDAFDDRDLKNAEASGNKLAQTGRKLGLAWGDAARGFRQGRGDLRLLDKAARDGDNTLAKLGRSVGIFTKNIGNLVNLRWFFLISAVQILGHAVVVLGANLVALAASAISAGAALGAGLAAGLAQAIPVAGLLAASMNRVTNVLNAVKIASKPDPGSDTTSAAKTQREAMERLADANYALKTSKESVGEAERSLKDAMQGVTDAVQAQKDSVENLADARKQAARDIVDANFEERDAALALQQAELGVVEAKQRLLDIERQQKNSQQDKQDAQAAVREAQQRLQIAQQEGDQAEIGKANTQLAIAQQNLQEINNQADTSNTQLKDAQLNIKQAELAKQQAVVRDKRARQDAAKARKEGISGNQQVIDAQKQLASSAKSIADAQHNVVLQQRQVRDSVHSLAIAQREQKDAQNDATGATAKQTTAQKNLNAQLAQLDPAERKLFRSIRRIQGIYKQNIRPITDIIINSFAFAVDRAGIALQNPKLLKALKTLATALAGSIRELARFFTSKGFLSSFAEFTRDAAKNIPVITDILKNLVKAFLDVAKAGTPVFNGLLKGLDRLTKGIAGFTGKKGKKQEIPLGELGSGLGETRVTRQKSPLQEAIGVASKDLNSWLKLLGAIGRVLFFLTKGARGAGTGLVQDLTRFFDHVANFLRDNPEKVKKFFDNMREAFKALAILGGTVAKVLFGAFTGKDAEAFTKLIVQVVIPGLALLIETLGFVSKILLAIFGAPVLGPILKFALTVLVAEKALNRIFPATQHLTNAVKKLTGIFLKEGIPGVRKYFGLLLERFNVATKAAQNFAKRVGQQLSKIGEVFVGGGGKPGLIARVKQFGISLGQSITSGTGKAVTKLKTFAATGATIISNFAKSAIERLAAINFATMASSFGAALASMGRSIVLFARLVAVAFITPPLSIVFLIGAAITALILLDQKFHFIMPTIKLLGEIAKKAFGALVDGVKFAYNWIKDHWKLILAILTGPFGLAVYAVLRWKDKIIGFIKAIIDWVKDHWKTIVAVILAIFLPGGAILLGIWKFRNQIVAIFKGIGTAIINAFKHAFEWVKKEILALAHWIGDKLSKLPLVGRFLGGGSKDDGKPSFDPKFVQSLPVKAQKEAAALSASGKSKKQILDKLVQDGVITKKERAKIEDKQNLAVGGVIEAAGGKKIPGPPGTAVPIVAHAGEWVVNKAQQMELGRRLNMSGQQIQAWLFGGKKQGKPGKDTGTKATGQRIRETNWSFTLASHVDPDGILIWFIEFDDGSFGQITPRDAARIQKSHGNYIPGYVKRDEHSLTQTGTPNIGQGAGSSRLKKSVRSFLEGGIIPSMPTFDMGGVVPGQAPAGPTINSPGGDTTNKTVNQHFNVKTEGETDWNYVMRLSAINAQSSF